MIKELKLKGWWEKYAPVGSKIQQVETVTTWAVHLQGTFFLSWKDNRGNEA